MLFIFILKITKQIKLFTQKLNKFNCQCLQKVSEVLLKINKTYISLFSIVCLFVQMSDTWYYIIKKHLLFFLIIFNVQQDYLLLSKWSLWKLKNNNSFSNKWFFYSVDF